MSKFLNLSVLMAGACCDALDNIERVCGGNAKGLKTKTQVACIDDVASIPPKDDYPTTGAPHTVSTDIVMEATKVFKTWNFSRNDNGYVAEPQGDSDNTSWLTKVNYFIPKLTPLTTHIFNGTANGEYICIIKDKNSQQRIIGDKEDGATIKVQEQTGDKNGYLVTIEWESSYLPLYYTGTIPV